MCEMKILTSKLLFLAVESCNALTHMSATSAQPIPCKRESIHEIIKGSENDLIKMDDIWCSVIKMLLEKSYFLGQISVLSDLQVLPEGDLGEQLCTQGLIFLANLPRTDECQEKYTQN